MRKKVLALILALLLPWGCASEYSHHTYLKVGNVFKQKIAVLPFANETVDFDASPVFRYAVQGFLAHKGYQLLPTDQVNAVLKEQGISEGGQLSAFTPRELGEFLGADLLLYGTVTEFNTKYALIYSSIQVQGRFKLVQARTGNKIWEATSGSYSNNFSRIFFVGDLINLLATLDLEEFVTNNNFVKFFKEDEEENIFSEEYLRRNVRGSTPALRGKISLHFGITPETGRAIMQGAKKGIQSISQNIDRKEGMIVALVIFLTWTLLYAIFDNYDNYVVETVTKGFSTFPGMNG